MHKLMEYICEELEEMERKADKDGKLSMAEIEYVDKLAHIKKSLLSAEEMWENSEYSMTGGGSYRGGSYARGGNQGGGGQSNRGDGGSYARGGGNRGGGGRRGGANQYGSYGMEGYSRGAESMVQELRDLMQDAPDDRTRKEFERFINKIEQM